MKPNNINDLIDPKRLDPIFDIEADALHNPPTDEEMMRMDANMERSLDELKEIWRKMGKTDEEIDRGIAIGRKNAISGKMSAQMAINQMIKDQDNNTAAKAFGHRLKELRKEQRMGKQEVAMRAGMKVSTLTAIEEGRYNTGIRQITDIAHALGAHVSIVPDETNKQ